ncbi:hypothetical protein IAU60_006437 [Kwoniella sp. DSM 27419]
MSETRAKRTRVKSQRVLEAEDTRRYLRGAREVVREPTPEPEVYCVCRTDSGGPMIECGECNDWWVRGCGGANVRFHFACVGVTEDEAERIHTHDIASFPSPSPSPKRRQVKRRATPSYQSSSSGSSSSAASPEPPKPAKPKPQKVPPQTLPPVRKYVRDQLLPRFATVFTSPTLEDTVARIEEAMYHHFKDVVGGKETAGTRYNSSIARGLRPELATALPTMTPVQIATLTSADLASEEQLAQLQKAKQAALEQTVKPREDVAAIRIGRDGFEKVENAREREMKLLAEQEQTARIVPPKREPTPPPPAPVVEPKFVSKPEPASLLSAWGKEPSPEPFHAVDQTTLDLSDIAPDVDIAARLDSPDPPDDTASFLAQPILWSGGIVNPSNPSPHTPPVHLRLVARSPLVDFPLLLPRNPIEITGRVPTTASLQFLSDTRLNPAKQIITAAITLDPRATPEQISAWDQIIQFHIQRDRHALYRPYDNAPSVPPAAAREIYLIPLRPSDPSPDLTDLLDGYSLPTRRTQSLLLALFISNKPAPPPNHNLQALMASLNPAALQAVRTPSHSYHPERPPQDSRYNY